MRLITSLVLLSALTALSGGCSSSEKPRQHEYVPSAEPQTKVFAASFDKVWRGAQLALSHYPIKINDMDAGVLETAFIRGKKLWRSPHSKKFTPGGQRYKISMRIIKGHVSGRKEAVRVTILKRAEIKPDFFSDYKRQPSDGLEEIALMYRIQRELTIQRVLERVSEDQDKKKK